MHTILPWYPLALFTLATVLSASISYRVVEQHRGYENKPSSTGPRRFLVAASLALCPSLCLIPRERESAGEPAKRKSLKVKKKYTWQWGRGRRRAAVGALRRTGYGSTCGCDLSACRHAERGAMRVWTWRRYLFSTTVPTPRLIPRWLRQAARNRVLCPSPQVPRLTRLMGRTRSPGACVFSLANGPSPGVGLNPTAAALVLGRARRPPGRPSPYKAATTGRNPIPRAYCISDSGVGINMCRDAACLHRPQVWRTNTWCGRQHGRSSRSTHGEL